MIPTAAAPVFGRSSVARRAFPPSIGDGQKSLGKTTADAARVAAGLHIMGEVCRGGVPIPKTLLAALAAAVLVPLAAQPAELGRITISSGVGEPLQAEVEVVGMAPGEARSLAARIPPAEVYWRANIEPSPMLRTIRAAVERRPQGRYVVTLRSTEAMPEPFMDLLLEISSDAGRSMREYTFLLDEAGARKPPPIAAPNIAPIATPDASPGAAPEAPRGVAGTIATDESARAPGASGYEVRPGDTLAGIAQEYQPPGVTLEQMMVALYQANEPAFLDGNMNLLKIGRTLTIPDPIAARATSPDAARRIVIAHRIAFEQRRNQLAQAAGRASAGPERPAPAAGRVSPPAEPTPPSAPDQLRLSRADEGKAGGAAPGAAREDDLVAVQRALAEAQERISLLEKSLQDVRTLLELKNQQLAQAASPARPATTGGGGGGAAAAEMNAPPPSVAAPIARAGDSSLARAVARALAWMSLGAAAVLLPIGGFVWFRSRHEERQETMLRQATGRRRHKRRGRRGAHAPQADAGAISNEA